MELTLQDLLDKYTDLAPETKLEYGIGSPMSWRGSYDEVAFPIVKNTTAKECLSMVNEALDNIFTGWKGGDYGYESYAEVHFEGGEGEYSDEGYTMRMIEDIQGEAPPKSLKHQLLDLI